MNPARPAHDRGAAMRPETNRVPGFWFITLITSFVLLVSGKQHRALHDYIADTVVLYDPNKVLAS